MKTSSRKEALDQKIESLLRQRKELIHQEREAKKKRYQRQCYAVGELFIKYFSDVQNIEPGTKCENAENFAPLAQFFDMLASDKATMELFTECLSCTQDNRSNV